MDKWKRNILLGKIDPQNDSNFVLVDKNYEW